MTKKVYRSFDQPKGVGYPVKGNRCDCHPETCCCNDYAVHTYTGEKFATFYTKEQAHKVADAFNRVL